MTLQDQINNNLKDAMRAKNVETLSVLRMLVSALKNKQISLQHDLTDEDILGVIASQAKQRKDSIEQYREGNREELAQKEEKELAILNAYLPEQMGETEIRNIINDAITKTGAQGPQDMGKVMGALMPQIKGKADGALVSKLVKEALNK